MKGALRSRPIFPSPPSLDGPREGDESSSGRMQIQPNPAARSLYQEIYQEDGPRDPGFQLYPKPLPIQATVPSLGCRVGSRGPLSKELPRLRRLSDDTFFGDNEKGEDIFLHTGGGGSDVRVMSVRLPSVKQDQESVSLSSVEGDTDSSANDVF